MILKVHIFKVYDFKICKYKKVTMKYCLVTRLTSLCKISSLYDVGKCYI